MKRILFLGMISIMMLGVLAACQPQPQPTNVYGGPVINQMNASGVGQVYLNPDIAYISIGVETRSDQVSAALNENNTQVQQVAETLKELGVADEDIQTTAFNIYPQQEYDMNGQVIGTTYVVNNTVYVTVRDLQKMGDMLDAVVRAGANSIYGITFDIANKDEAFSEARRLAIENAKANAQEIADAAGVELGELMSINTYSPGGAVPLFEGKNYLGAGGAADMASVPVQEGQMMIIVNADLVFGIK